MLRARSKGQKQAVILVKRFINLGNAVFGCKCNILYSSAKRIHFPRCIFALYPYNGIYGLAVLLFYRCKICDEQAAHIIICAELINKMLRAIAAGIDYIYFSIIFQSVQYVKLIERDLLRHAVKLLCFT